MKGLKLACLLGLLASTLNSMAQAEGKVIDEHGEPIAGATVRWEGTNVGTTTDANGKFRLEKNGHLHEVVTSMMGYRNDTTCSHSAKFLVIRLYEIAHEMHEAEVLDDSGKYDTLVAFLEVRGFREFEELVEKYGASWDDKGFDVWKKTFSEYMRYTKYILHMSGITGKQYGLPSLSPNNPMMGAIVLGIEELFSNLLGIQQLSVAMRRSPDKIEEFINRWDEERITPAIEKIRNGKGPNYKYCFDSSILMLAHNVMNKKQFERFYWPHMKELLDAYAEKGMNIRIFTEGSILRFAEYFKDYPKGVLTFHIEQDDPFAFREALPNVCIMGGLSTELLANGTPDECVAYTKRLCDELGKDGGFILSEGKMLSYRNDANRENYKAVCDFVSNYKL